MNTGDDGTLHFSLAVDVSQFEAGIASIESMVAKASAKSDVELKKVQKSIENIGSQANAEATMMQRHFGLLGDSIGSLGKAVAGFGMAFTAQSLIQQIISVRGEFQKLEVSFRTMLGSEEKATALMEQLLNTAAKTPFDLQSISDGARQLLAYGENVNNVNDDLIRLGNIAAGLSQPLNDLVYLYGTTMTQGRLYTADLNQFTGRGIPMIRELANVLGVAESKVRGLVEEGKVGFPEVQKVIQNLTNEGGMFYNLMEEQSKTISGQISNIGDAISSMFNEIGQQSEGIINGALNAVSSLVENYEQVGRILLGLVATYGVYRTACIAVAAAHTLQAAGVGTLTAAEAIHYGWLVVVEKAQKLLNATMLANPYVLVATLIAGTIAALMSMKTETERMREAEEEYQDAKQKTIDAEEEHKRKIEELCDIAGDEAVATDTRREALNKLEMKYPDIFAKYDTEYEKLKNIKKIKLEIAELEAGKSITLPKNELNSVEKRIKELEAIKKTERWEDANASGTRMRKVGGLNKQQEVELNNLYKKRNNLKTQVHKNDVNAYFENLTGISNKTLEQQIKQRKTLLANMQMEEKKYGKITYGNAGLRGTFSRDEIKYQLNKLQSEQNRRNQKRGSSSDWGASARKEYEKALKEYNTFISSSSNKLTQEEFEKKAKELKEAVDTAKKAYDATKPATNKDAAKLQKQYEKEQKEEQKRAEKKRLLGQELVQIEQETRAAEIEAMEEGMAKKLAMIDLEYTEQKNKLNKQESDWKKKNKDAGGSVNANGLTAEQSDALNKAREANDEKHKKATEKVLKDEAEMQEEAMREYLIKYGTLQEKITALTEQTEKRMQNAIGKGAQMSLSKELEKAIGDAKFDELKKSINWEAIFGDIDKQSLSSLQHALDKIRSVDTSSMNVSDIKDLQEAMTKIEDEIASRNPFTALAKSIQDIGKYKGELVASLNEYAAAQREITEAQTEYNLALQAQNELQEQVDNGSLSKDSEKYKNALEATAEAQNKLNRATEKSNSAERNALNARNNITVSYKKFASNLKSVNGVIKDVGGQAKNLASVFSDDVAESINKSINFLSEMLDATSTVIDAIGDTGKSVASAMETTAKTTGTAVQGTAQATSAAISTVEKASVILAVISAALQVATAIASLFNDDEEKQKEIERLQERIDQLQWELDNADAIRLQKSTGDALARLKNILSETTDEVLKLHLTTNQYYSAWGRWIGSAIYENEIFQNSVEKLADTYAGMAYTADKALGSKKYDDARGQLENLAKQQILLQQQINEENSKKDSDSGQIAEWQRQIQEKAEQMVSIINEMMEDIIGYTAEDLASELGEAFIEAARQGEDAMEAWHDKVNDIVSDILRRMMIQEVLEKPIGDIFDRYKKKWFGSDGTFQGFNAVEGSLTGFASELNGVVQKLYTEMGKLPDELKNLLIGDAERQGTSKGIATASQDSVDENNARLTTIQGHTYSINQGVIELNRTGNAMLEKLTAIEENTAKIENTNDKLDVLNKKMGNMSETLSDIETKGLRLKS